MQIQIYSWSLLCVVGIATLARGQDSIPSVDTKVSKSFPSGTEKITEASVSGTVSYLASDELAGRGTASKEFDIAAAYVASRFRAAGLSGAGDDGSFFHITPFPVRYLPTSAQIQTSQGKSLPVLGVLGASSDEVHFQGTIHTIDSRKPDSWKDLHSFVLTELESSAKGQRALSQLARLSQQLEAAGAKGILLRVPSDSDWITLAKESIGLPQADSRGAISIPVLLISATADVNNGLDIRVPPAVVKQVPMRNVIAKIPGSDPVLSQQAVLFSAHLDHLGSRNLPGDNIYNGADDDATGVTAVLTLADAFAASKEAPKRTLLFMTFWGEEMGLLGSKAFADRPSWPLESLVANINIEMIGRPEDGARGKIWMTGWSESNLGSLTQKSARAWNVDIFDHPQFSAMLYKSSDNWSFAQRGVIAHSFSAGSLHADYHQVTDEWDRLEIPHMVQVIRGLFLATQELARGDATPVASK